MFVAPFLLLSSACSEKPRDPYEVLTVPIALANLGSLDGQMVDVRGWLTDPCGGYSCAIFPNPVKQGEDWPKGPHLSIAGETLAEPLLAKYQGKQVLLRGILSSRCRAGGYACKDRAPDITPTNIFLLGQTERH